MKHSLAAVAALLFSSLVIAESIFPPVKVEKVNDRVYSMLGPSDVPNNINHGYVNNILIIIGDSAVILVDAGSHKAVAKHIDNAIKTVTDKPITHVLITHHHPDRHLGLEYFQDAKVIATVYCAEQIKENSFGLVDSMRNNTGLPLVDNKTVVPQIAIALRSQEKMDIHGVKLELISTDITHTHGNMMVWLPDDAVLASGDILLHAVNPNFRDGNLKKWIGVVDHDILALPFETVLPGHGPLMQRDDVAEFRNLIADFYETVEDIYNADSEETEVREKLNLEKWQNFARFNEMMGRNINKVWLEVEEANF